MRGANPPRLLPPINRMGGDPSSSLKLELIPRADARRVLRRVFVRRMQRDWSGAGTCQRGNEDVSFGQHYRNIGLNPAAAPLTDKKQITYRHAMGKAGLNSGRSIRELIAVAVACLFLLQALGFVFSANGRFAFSNGGSGASIAMAGEICHDANLVDSGKPPSPNHKHHQNCAFCTAGTRSFPLPAVILIAVTVAMIAPHLDEFREWIIDGEQTPLSALGWTSSWSSRAPPFFS